jgi:hypothetical protein
MASDQGRRLSYNQIGDKGNNKRSGASGAEHFRSGGLRMEAHESETALRQQPAKVASLAIHFV